MPHGNHVIGSLDCLGCLALDRVDDVIFVADPEGRIVFWNRAAVAFYGVPVDDAVGQLAIEFLGSEWRSEERVAEAAAALGAGREWGAVVTQTKADGTAALVHAVLQPILDPDGSLFVIARLRDVTERRELETQRDLLFAAVEQAAESVVITDVDANIEYVNPAFEEASGYRRDEVIGRNPRFLKSGAQTDAFYRTMWSRLTSGETFRAEFDNRRRDGSIYHEIATISPVIGADGLTHHYAAVKRDVTRQRAFERRIDREARERATAMEAIGALRPGKAAEETALAIASVLVNQCGFSEARLISFEANDQAVTLAHQRAGDVSATPRLHTADASRRLVERAASGPWIESSGTLAGERDMHRRRAAQACAPVNFGGDVVGLLVVGSPVGDVDGPAARLAFLVELASLTAGLLGPALDARRVSASTRRLIQAIIDERAFRSVFQPLADLETGDVIGYEALTRFDDSTPPDVMFATAARCGLGLDLEECTIGEALARASTLPATGPLHINASPALIVEETRLRRLLRNRGRAVTLELTEHDPIADYDAIRVSLRRIDPHLALAVDDAGAGFASLRHILELRPHLVKLDRFLVSSVDSDPTRQALVAGMVHFAAATSFDLLAEGVETEAERRCLLQLGVPMGQGWLLGRPQAAPAPIDGARGSTERSSPTGLTVAKNGPARRRRRSERREQAAAPEGAAAS